MPISMTSNGSKYYLHYDQVGTLKLITDANHNIVKEITYDTFGNILNDTNQNFKIPFGFAGGLHDRDTNLVHFGYREYDPQTGKWTAKDPIGFDGGDANLYGYVLQDPVNFIDPEGLKWEYDTKTGMLTQYGPNGNKGNSWNSNSGPWGKGELPLGKYNLPSPPVPVPKSHPKQTSYCDKNGNCWWQPISPDFDTDRTGLGIHPDGNPPGTAGCIGAKNANTSDLFKALQNDNSTLIVR